MRIPLLFLALFALLVLPPANPAAAQRQLACQTWQDFNDADFALHAKTFKNLSPCIAYEPFEASGTDWRLVRIQRSATVPEDAPLVVVLHDDEDAAFLGALGLLGRFDVQIVALDTGEERLWQGMDPNRLFVETGAIISGCAYADRLDHRFASAILRDWNPRFPLISLHSNAPGHRFDQRGGRGSISLLFADPDQRAFAGVPDPAQPRLSDPDNLVFLGGPGPVPSPRQARLIPRLQSAGLNVLYDPILEAAQDCSLSDFLSLRGQSDLYFNAEVEEGDFETALTMTQRLMTHLFNLEPKS